MHTQHKIFMALFAMSNEVGLVLQIPLCSLTDFLFLPLLSFFLLKIILSILRLVKLEEERTLDNPVHAVSSLIHLSMLGVRYSSIHISCFSTSKINI